MYVCVFMYTCMCICMYVHVWIGCIIIWEIFMYENIHVLNVCVNIFSHINILTQNFGKLEIPVPVLLHNVPQRQLHAVRILLQQVVIPHQQ